MNMNLSLIEMQCTSRESYWNWENIMPSLCCIGLEEKPGWLLKGC